MKNALQTDLWSISEDSFRPENQLNSELIFGIGNGKIRQMGNFEEFYSEPSKPGTYLSGVYINKDPETTIIQLSNLPNWTKIIVRLNAESLDVAQCEILSFKRALNMKQGLFERNFEVITSENNHLEVSVQRFLSLAQPEVGVIKYAVKSLNFNGKISFSPIIDGDFNNENPEWNVLQSKTQKEIAHLWIQTRKTNFQVCEAMSYDFFKNNAQIKTNPTKIEKQKVAGFSFGTDIKTGDSVCVYKFVAILNSLDYPYKEVTTRACDLALSAKNSGWMELFEENCTAWEQKWENSNIEIDQDKIYETFMKCQPGSTSL